MALSDSLDDIRGINAIITPDFDIDDDGNADFHNNKGVNLDTPTASSDAANKAYVDTRTIEIKVVDDSTTLTTGDGKVVVCVPSIMDGLSLIDADAFISTVSSSGIPTIQIRNVTDSIDMLSTRITIDVNENTSYTAATQPVINTDNDLVSTGDLIAIDVDVAGTGAIGLGVILRFG